VGRATSGCDASSTLRGVSEAPARFTSKPPSTDYNYPPVLRLFFQKTRPLADNSRCERIITIERFGTALPRGAIRQQKSRFGKLKPKA
jgi:hypothetical protein